MGNVVPIKGSREAPKADQSRMETLILSINHIQEWQLPPFQRPLRINDKVRAGAEELKHSEEIKGVITLGRIRGKPTIWMVDGQHRIEMFKLSGIEEVFADIRLIEFDSFADMAAEFVRLNSSFVRMRPDDILRGMEANIPALRIIREKCEFIGYDQIRRNGKSSAVLSMSSVIRCWCGSLGETPVGNTAGRSAAQAAEDMDTAEMQDLIVFLLTAHSAWGRDAEYFRLWGNLNLTICMWMWRRLVRQHDHSLNRSERLTPTQFRQCLMSVSAATSYLEWLQGRVMGDRDRSPCYKRLKTVFVHRMAEESKSGKKPKLPVPPWSSK